MTTYRFSAIKGVQAGKEFYTAMLPLNLIGDLFEDSDPNIPAEFRAQRKLNKRRIPAIKKYVIDNRNSYVFSALAASIDGNYTFVSLNDDAPDLGVLQVEKDAVFLINDGQHRRAAIVEAMKEDETLGKETIAVVFYKDNGLKNSQQMFTDLNKHAVKTSNSISELYDSTDPLAELTRMVVEKINFFDKYTDREKDNLSKYSAALFVFNTFYKANKRIVGKDSPPYDIDFVTKYWMKLVECVDVWADLETGSISKVKLRSDYLICQSVVIEALGEVGNYFYNNRTKWEQIFSEIKNVDWRRNNPIWKYRCIKDNNKMVKSEKSICLTANAIKIQLGASLDEEEQYREFEIRRIGKNHE